MYPAVLQDSELDVGFQDYTEFGGLGFKVLFSKRGGAAGGIGNGGNYSSVIPRIIGPDRCQSRWKSWLI